MNPFSLDDQQLQYQNTVVEFATRELNDDIASRDKRGDFPYEQWKKCAQMGLMALPFPEKYGGCNTDFVTTAIAVEALAYACKDSGLVHAVITQLLSGISLFLFGNEEQKLRHLVPVCRGENIAAQAVTEAGAGSDVSSMRTTAARKGDRYIVQGNKQFISNGPVADTILLLALTGSEPKKLGAHTFFILDKTSNGFSRGKPIEKMGLRTLSNCELIFDECAIPPSDVIGREGQGLIIFNEIMEWERILFGACHVGVMKRILEKSVRYAKARKQFEQPIGKYQSVSSKIARMKINLELARLMVYHASSLKDLRKRTAMEASIIKVFASESLKSACLDAVQIHGAYGYTTEFEVERDLRDSIASTIYSGTSEINVLVITRLLGL